MNLLIVEDEKSLAREIDSFLRNEQILCEVCHTGKEASEKISVNLYDFVLLDLGLPDYDGLDLIREARKINNDVSFIIITARGAIEDKVNGLNLGADDYLSKPFSLIELHSRIMAVARRRFHIPDNIVSVAGFSIDIKSKKMFFKEKEVELTRKEFELVEYLVLNKGKVLTRNQLYEHIWGNILDDQYDSNFIDVHIKNVRRKISAHGPASWLETVRGIGYMVNSQ
ncbi:MAG TPA: response regulator transcription factor [Bacteroidales bacterium]|nr:response regulator transcription factor [Bacteroidales bacterium]